MLDSKTNNPRPPSSWTEEMLKEFAEGVPTSTQGYNSYLLLITGSEKDLELNPSGTTTRKLTFIGSLAASQSSSLKHVLVTVSLHPEADRYGRALEISKENDAGYIILTERDPGLSVPRIPHVMVVLFVGDTTHLVLEQLLDRSKQFGNEHVPIWLWADVQPIKRISFLEASEFLIDGQFTIKKCHVEQVLDLRGAAPQDLRPP